MAKPGDHPDFFRFPAPEGTSRESTIVLDAVGNFSHDGVRIERRAMQVAFSRWIAKHPEDGRYILQNGYDWTYFTVEDVPFFVTSLESRHDAMPWARLSDDSTEELAPQTLSVDALGALYCQVKSGQFDARFLPSVQNSLLPYLRETPQGIAFAAGGLCTLIPSR